MNLSPSPDASLPNLPRQLRRFMGLLMNAEKELRARDFDVTEAYRFAVREHDRWLALSQENPGTPLPTTEIQAMRKVASELHERMGQALALWQTNHTSPQVFAEYLAAHQRASATPSTQATEPSEKVPPKDDPTEPPTMGVSWDRLLALRARLGTAELPHEFVAPFLIFLIGLKQGWADPESPADPSPSTAEDGLITAATQSLRDAVEFALQEKAQALVDSSSGLAGDTEFQCMFMGVAFAQKNHTESVNNWLHRDHYQKSLVRMLFAMGVLAATNRQARRLTIKFASRLPLLVEDSFGPEAREIFQNFFPAQD